MEEEKKYIDELIASYLAESLDEDKRAELKGWIAASAENKAYFIRQREVWFSAVSREAASIYDKDKAFGTFKERIRLEKRAEIFPEAIPFISLVALCGSRCSDNHRRISFILER